MRASLLTPLFCSALALHAQERVERWPMAGAALELRFNAGLMRDLGFELSAAPAPDADGYVAFQLAAAGRLVALAPGGLFRDVEGGELQLSGGPALRFAQGQAALAGAWLRRGPDERTLEIASSGGERLFVADHMHFAVDRAARRLRFFNLDLRLSPELAARIGEPRHAGLAVGVLVVEGGADVPAREPEQPLCTSGGWGPGDVGLINIGSVGQVVRESGFVGVSPSATLKNVGTKDVPWHAKFTAPQPPYNNDQHPFLVWNMYRVAGGRLEQIGVSPLKHAFLTTNTNCACGSGHILWLNCEDIYGVSTNDSSGSLGPRPEITSHTGIWRRCGSIFDPECDNVQNSAPRTSTFDRRMAVLETDLQTAGAQYYVDSWYVVRDDVNIFNTMGWRTVTPVFGGASWSFTLTTALKQGPVIDLWVDLSSPGPNAENSTITRPEGALKLAVRATDLGGGQWRYAYALHNFDFDPRVNSFSLPLPAGAAVTNVGFHDADGSVANDWTVTVTPGTQIVWQAPTAAVAQPWGTLFSFSFEINASPSTAGELKPTFGVQDAPGGTFDAGILGPGTLTPVELLRFGIE